MHLENMASAKQELKDRDGAHHHRSDTGGARPSCNSRCRKGSIIEELLKGQLFWTQQRPRVPLASANDRRAAQAVPDPLGGL